LSDELVFGLRSEEVTSLQVARHIGGLSGGASSDNTSNQVKSLRGFGCQSRALGNSSEDELRGFGDGRDRVDIGVPSGLHSDEREDEAEEEGEDSLSNIHVEYGREDRAAHDGAEDQSRCPPSSRDSIFKRCLICVFWTKSLLLSEPAPRVQRKTVQIYHKYLSAFVINEKMNILLTADQRNKGQDDIGH